jgi:NADP-dependent aldehyde dehydrogenase
MGTGQMCTNPGLVFLLAGPDSEAFVAQVRQKFTAAPVGTLLSEGVLRHLERGVAALVKAGAEVLAGGQTGGGKGASHQNTLLRVSGEHFAAHAAQLQTEAFGNCSLFVVVRDAAQLQDLLGKLEGNLTGSIYTATDGRDDSLYDGVATALRRRVGRLLNDRMPTGVAVSPAMNHGGPFPATGHPGFTAVGIPASIQRFAMLCCYDNVRQQRLPAALQDKNPGGKPWRSIDGAWTVADVAH